MNIEVATPISAEAEIKQYTLVGDDIYVKRYTNKNIPTWYRQLISDIIATDVTITDIDAAVAYLSTLPAGYNQMITELQNADTTINTSLTSLVATTGSHTAAIANLGITKVDATSAAAISLNTIGAYFADGSAGAWFNNQISTYASDITANAMNISTLSATVDGHTVSINTVEEISIAKSQVIRSATAPTILTHPLLKAGDIWVNTANEITKSWNGTAWVDTTSTQGAQAYTWSATASKLITSPDGSITGWSFGDGTNTQSSFNIYADSFKVLNPTDPTQALVEFNTQNSTLTLNGDFYTYTLDRQFYSVLSGGDLKFYKVGNSTPYKYLKNIQTGTAIPTGSTVTLTGFFNEPPVIMVSSNSIATYDPAYADRTQVQNIGYSDFTGSTTTGIWTFKPRAELALSASSNTVGSIASATSVNYAGLAYNTPVVTYTASSITPTLTTKIDITSGTFRHYFYHITGGGVYMVLPITVICVLQTSTDNINWTDRSTKTSSNWSTNAPTDVYTEFSASISGLTSGILTAGQYYYRLKIQTSVNTELTNYAYNWAAGSYAYLSTSTAASFYTTTGTTVLQSGFLNYIAVGR